jgi:hypothetical protein
VTPLSAEERQRLAESLASALRASTEAAHASGQAGAHAGRQASEIEALLEVGERLALRGRDLRAGLAELREMLERGRLATLNAALEGARLGEVAGKALLAMTDEVRGALEHGEGVVDGHANRIAELERERERLLLGLGPLADAARAVATEASLAADRVRTQQSALAELALELRQRLGVDPELGGLVARATREASSLLETLAALEARGAREQAQQLRERLTALSATRETEEP